MVLRFGLRCCVLMTLALGAVPGSWAGETEEAKDVQATCAVPSQRPTIQAALDDPICSTIQVAGGTYHEILSVSRSTIMIGSGPPVIRGNIGVRGGVTFSIENFQIQPYSNAIQRPLCAGLAVIEGAVAYPNQTVILEVAGSGSCLNARGDLIFADGFENGSTNRW